jgi:hypothetical protein
MRSCRHRCGGVRALTCLRLAPEDEQVAMAAARASLAGSAWLGFGLAIGRIKGDDVLPVLQPLSLACLNDRAESVPFVAAHEHDEGSRLEAIAELWKIGEAAFAWHADREIGPLVRSQRDEVRACVASPVG